MRFGFSLCALALVLVSGSGCSNNQALQKALAEKQAAEERAVAAEKRATEETPREVVEQRRIKWEDWQYPNVAHTFYRGFDGAKTWHVVCASADSFDDVVAFFAKKLPAGNGVKQDFAFDNSQTPPVRFPKTESFGGWEDSIRVPEPADKVAGNPRPVKMRFFSYQVIPGGSVTILVSRADNEKHTHIIFWSLLPSSKL